MPSVAPPAKVLVSGANGFIAIWLVKDLLDRGYSVRGTVRSEGKGTHLLNTFKKEVDEGRLEVTVVPDITVPDAFKEAVVGVDAIEHTASPFHFNVSSMSLCGGFIVTKHFLCITCNVYTGGGP